MTLLGIESDIGIFGSMVINDLEWLGERIMHAENTKDRIEHWIAFESFYDKLPQRLTFGRNYNTRNMCSVVVALTVAQEIVSSDVDGPNGLRVENIETKMPHKPLIEWSDHDWNCLKQVIHSVHEDILRKDASKRVWLMDSSSQSPEDNSVHIGRARSTLYSLSELQNTLKYIKIQQALCPLGETRKQLFQSNECQLDENNLDAFWQRVKEEQDPQIKKLLLELFQMSSTEDSPRPPLKAGDELKNMLKQEQLLASNAAEKVHKLLLSWFCDVFEESPVLNKVYLSDERPGPYQGEPNCAPSSIRARVNDASQRFPNAASVIDGIRGLVGGVAVKARTNEVDPFWQRATDGIVGKLRKTAKLSGSQTPFLDKTMKLGVAKKAESDHLEESNNFVDLCESDSSDGSNGNCDHAGAEAEQVRKRKRDDNDLDYRPEDSQMGRKRRPWSDEEKRAVREGYYEKGNDWAGIKRLYYSTLKFRSNVDIKDCHRTMTRRGEMSL